MDLKIEDMPFIPLSHLRKLVRNMSKMDNDTQITFEFLMTACFPTIWENIQAFAKNCYTRGYLQAKEDMEDENKRSSI